MYLEKRIEELERKVSLLEAELAVFKTGKKKVSVSAKKYGRVTDAMLASCYKEANKLYENRSKGARAAAEQLAEKTGMNPNTAVMTVFAAYALISGELYKRTISGKSAQFFLDCIERDYGKSGLQKAVAALRMHVEYRRKSNHTESFLALICDQYQAVLG